VSSAKDFELTITFLNSKEKKTIAELISFLLKLNPEISKHGSLFMQTSWSINLLFPSLILKERFILQLLKSKYLNKKFSDFGLSQLSKKEEAQEMLSNFREMKFLISELDNIEKKTESAFNKKTNSQIKIRFEDLLYDEEHMESTRKNWKKSVYQNDKAIGEKNSQDQNPILLKEKLMLCKERIKEKEKEIEALDQEVQKLDAEKKDLEYMYGDQYLEEVFGENEILNLEKGNKQLEIQINTLEHELKDVAGSQEILNFDDIDNIDDSKNNFFK
jgi:chromosome segregation ATPase